MRAPKSDGSGPRHRVACPLASRARALVPPRHVGRTPAAVPSCASRGASAAVVAAFATGARARRGRRTRLRGGALREMPAARESAAREREPIDNVIRALFGAVYAALWLPFGGGANCISVEQGCVGIVLRFGKFDRLLKPGRHKFNIAVEEVRVVPLKTVCIDVQPQTVMTKDNLSVKIDAVCFYRVFDAEKALFAVQDYPRALTNLVQVTMRTVVGENALDELFALRPQINARITELIDESTTPWGVQISQVELKEVVIPQSMQRALAAVAEARQEAEAKLVQARAQRESASILAEASSRMGRDPTALQLQWFETLRIITTQGRNATIIVPDRIDPLQALRAVNWGDAQPAERE